VAPQGLNRRSKSSGWPTKLVPIGTWPSFCGRPRRGTCWLELGTPELAAPAGVETATNCLEGITALLDSVALAVSFAEVRRELVEDLNEEPLEGDEEL
jgi:hypothetical protein